MRSGPSFHTAVPIAAALLIGCATARADASLDEPTALARARQLLTETILVDGHNDLPWVVRTYTPAPGDVDAYDLRRQVPGQTDLKRLRQGGVGAQFWSVYTPGENTSGFARTQLEQIDIARRIIARYPRDLQYAGSVADIRAAHRAGRIASLLGMEGGHAIENSLGALRAFYELGARYMTLTHNAHTDWADSAMQMPARHGGLSPFGEKVVLEMNRLGMLVDLSHVSEETMDDALRVSKAPVIFSHSAAKALVDHPRNVPDAILRRLPQNGGVVMVAFVAGFVDAQTAGIQAPAYAQFIQRSAEAKNDAERETLFKEIFAGLQMPPVPVARVADHIEHIRDVAGIRHVGIGADYDGSSYWPEGMSDVSGYPKLFAELIRRGWSDHDLKLLAGENLLRAMRRAEDVAAELRASTPASTAAGE